MKNDIQWPAIKLPTKLDQFIKTFFQVFTGVLLIHLSFLTVYAFWEYDMSLVVSGFDFGSWAKWQRGLVLIPYLVLPITLAAVKVAGCSLSDLRDTLQRITKTRGQADEQSED